MNREHLVMIFFILFLSLVAMVYVRNSALDEAEAEKKRVDDALLAAVYDSGEVLSGYSREHIEEALVPTYERFCRSLYEYLGNYDITTEEISLYVPAFAVSAYDGLFICSLQKITAAEGKVFSSEWTECIPYMYETGDYIVCFTLGDKVTLYNKTTTETVETSFTEVNGTALLKMEYASLGFFDTEEAFRRYRSSAVSATTERAVSRAVNHHNEIAAAFGMTIMFGVPDFYDTLLPDTEHPAVLALFQGWPLTGNGTLLYSSYADSGAFLMERTRYLLEKSDEFNKPYAYYHRKNCANTGFYGTLADGTYTREELVREHGAFACPYCFDEAER